MVVILTFVNQHSALNYNILSNLEINYFKVNTLELIVFSYCDL